jgi:hypothetical protein
MPVKKGVKKVVLKPRSAPKDCGKHERIGVVNIFGDINTISFASILDKELYWLWTKGDKDADPLCGVKANIRLVTPTKVSIEPELYKITFWCGMTKEVSLEQLYQGCISHN